jgi:hypothetical protein
MRVTPRGLMLILASTVAGWRTSAAVTVAQRYKRAMKIFLKPKPAGRRRTKG